MKTTATVKAAEKDLTPVVLTVDTLISLVERIGAVERQLAELREVVKRNRDELSGNLQESVDGIYKDCIPEIALDGRLVFKTYNDAADPVQAFVQAEIHLEAVGKESDGDV